MQEVPCFHNVSLWHGGCNTQEQTKWRATGALSRGTRPELSLERPFCIPKYPVRHPAQSETGSTRVRLHDKVLPYVVRRDHSPGNDGTRDRQTCADQHHQPESKDKRLGQCRSDGGSRACIEVGGQLKTGEPDLVGLNVLEDPVWQG